MKDRKTLIFWSGMALAGLVIFATAHAVVVPALEQHAAETVTLDMPERDSLIELMDSNLDLFASYQADEMEADSALDAVQVRIIDARRAEYGFQDALVLRVEVTNHSRHAVGSFLATVTLRSPGRSIPWLTGESAGPGGIPGGIEPGETRTIEIVELDGGSEYADAPDDAAFTVEPNTLFVEDDEQINRLWEGIDLDAKLAGLRASRDSLAMLPDSVVLERWRMYQARDSAARHAADKQLQELVDHHP